MKCCKWDDLEALMQGLIFRYFQTLRVNTRGFYIQEGLGGHHENTAGKKIVSVQRNPTVKFW